jgi:hypothetical protein
LVVALLVGGALLVAFVGGFHLGFVGNVGDPGPGLHSRQLPVVAQPAAGLVDGSMVRVTSNAFHEPGAIVGVAVCLASAKQDGAKACDQVLGARYAVGAHGLAATYHVPRVITVDHRAIDCAARAGRCLLVAASADDFDQSGGVPISFAPNLPTVPMTVHDTRPQSLHLPIAAMPSASVRVRARVTIAVRGFQPGDPILVAWCTAALEREGPTRACAPLDAEAAVSAIIGRSTASVHDHADATGRFTASITVPRSVTPYEASPTERTRCDARPGACVLFVAAAADTARSAVLPIVTAG